MARKEFTPEQKQAWKEEKMAEQREMLESAVEQLVSQESWSNWIKFGRNNLRKYSFNNALLIWSQKRDASLVKGAKTWAKGGVTVNADAKRINILAPVMVKVYEDGHPVFDANGKPKVRVGFYRTVQVIDVTDTDSTDPLPKRAYKSLQGDDFVDLVPKLEGFARELGYVVRYTHSTTEEFDSTLHQIFLNIDQSVNQIVYKLVQYLAAIYGDIENTTYSDVEIGVITSSATYLALGQLGFDTSKTTVPFLTLADPDLKAFRAFTNTVEDIANKLAEKMGL